MGAPSTDAPRSGSSKARSGDQICRNHEQRAASRPREDAGVSYHCSPTCMDSTIGRCSDLSIDVAQASKRCHRSASFLSGGISPPTRRTYVVSRHADSNPPANRLMPAIASWSVTLLQEVMANIKTQAFVFLVMKQKAGRWPG